ncbi:choice-of-anchor D domain-containing protein [Hymenobacter daeguensis]
MVASSPATAPTTLTGFTAAAGTASASQTLTLSGANLTAGSAITITAPTDFEVSTDNSTFGTTASVANAGGGTLAGTPVYVRLKAGPTTGTYNSETVSVTGGGTTLATLATVNGTVTAAPPASLGTPTYLAGANPTAANPGGAFCSTSSVNLGVSFTSSGTFNAGNNFVVELSDPNGSFATPYATATVAGTTAPASPVALGIAAGTNSGAGYVIRVRSTSPVSTSSSSTALILVNNPTVSIVPPITQTYVSGAAANPLTATESFSTGTTRQWQIGNAAAGPFTNIPGETGITYTPTFSTPGTYYINVVSTFAACGSVSSSNVAEVIVTAPPANTISTPTFATAALCATSAASLNVTFTASGPYAATNNFLVQLSDASGSFAAPVTIGTLANNNATTAQTVPTTIPAGTPTGTGYLIRVVADNPAATSAGTSAALTIVSNPTVSIAPTATQTIVAGANGTALTATETTVAGTTRVWQSGPSATGPFTAISGQTGPSYTPTFATPGTYFVRALSTFAGCGDVASNVVEIDVNAPTPTITALTPSLAIAGSAGFTLTIDGTNFLAGATATFGGTSRVVTFVSATQLTVAVLAADIAAAGTKSVVVSNGGAATATATFTVTPAPPATAPCLTQGFETTVTPTGWLNTSVSRSTSAGDIKTGTAAATFASNTGSLTTATLNYPSLLTFALGRSTNATAKTMIVEVSTTTQTGTYTTVATYDHSNVPSGSYDVYSVDLSAYSTNASVWVRFRKVSSTTSPWRLDDVNVYCAPASEIDVTQGATPIASGGSYAYAATAVGASTDATFTIANTGTGTLNIAGIALSNNAGGAFSIQTTPLPTSVGAGANTPLVVRFAPTAAGSQTATLTITNDDSNEGTYTITLTGSTPPATEPTVQPTVTATAPTTTTVLLSLSGGDGARRLVVVRPTAAAAVAPIDGRTYTANTAYGTTTGTNPTTGPNNFVVIADGSTTSLTVTGLAPATAYTVEAYAYNDNGVAGLENYLAAAPGTASFTTLTPPAGAAQAGVLLLEDDFNGTAGTRLTANGWTAHSSAGSGSPMEIQATSLSYSEYPAGVSASNNQATSFGTGEDVNKGFTAPAGTTTLYVSSIINIGIDDNDYFMHLMDTNAPSTAVVFRGKVFTQSDPSGGFKFGLTVSNSSTAGAVYGPTIYNTGQNYLVVLKYVTNAGGNDEASLYVFDAAAPVIEPTTPTIGPLTEANAIAVNSLNAIALRQSNTTPIYDIDGIRVATGWGSAIGKPVFTGPAASLAAGNYYNVTVNNADQVTTTGAARIENNLTLTSGLLNTSGTNSLTLYQGAGTTGGSATSFVNGPLARITTGPATTVFPIGKGTAYRPLTLTATAQTSTTTFTGEIINSTARTTGVDAPLTRVSNIRYATITPDVQPTGFSGSLTMEFGADDYVTDPQASTFVIAKRDGNGNWQNLGHGTATGTAATGNVSGTLTSAVPITSFSDFALASTDAGTNNYLTNNPLPVELSAFSAQRQADKSVAVAWTTASEKNSARFEVQRSLNGRDFVTVATTKAQGSSARATAYTALDATAPAAQLYYRLRQVDADGTAAYSSVATVAGTSATAKVVLYPNPAHSTISFATEAATPYRVLNQLGQAVLHGTTEAGTAKVGVEQLPTGLYFIELQTATGRVVQKFEKE